MSKRGYKLVAVIATIVAIISGGVITLAYTVPLPVIKPKVIYTPYVRPAVSLNWPSQGEAAIGADGFGVLAQTASQSALPTASTAKILTALIVLQQKPLSLGQDGPAITMTAADVVAYQTYANEGGSVVQVQAGEQMSEYQALEAMLLPSANNIAQTLAVWLFGSMDNYTNYANKLVLADGLSATHVVDASGFLPATVSSPHDMVALSELALQNPVFAQIVSQSQATIPVVGIVKNVNWLLGKDGIEGVKTGNTSQAGGCYVFSAPQTIDGHEINLVGAIMGAPDLTTAINDAIPLLDSAKPHLKTSTVISAGQSIGTYITPWKTSVNAIAAHDMSMLTWDGLAVKPIIKLDAVKVPLTAGSKVGSLGITVGNTSDNVSLILQNPLSKPELGWSLRHLPGNLRNALKS